MYVRIETRKNKFTHNSNSKLLFGVAIGESRAMLFYSNGNFYEYDLFQEQILYTSTLDERPFKAISISPSQIICIMANSRNVVKVDIAKKSLEDLCRLPLATTHDQTRDKAIFFLTTIHRFRQTRSFYVDEPSPQENRRRIIYFPDPSQLSPGAKQKYVFKDFEYQNFVFEAVDECSRICIYRQNIEADRPWELRIVDLAAGFAEARYQLQHKSLHPAALVQQVWLKNPKQFIVFVNGAQPQILIVNTEKQPLTIVQCAYRPAMNFERLCYFNPELQLGCLCYLANTRVNGQLFENVVELVNFKKGALVQSAYMTLKDLSVAWDNEYMLDISAQNRSGNVSLFHTRHLIKKKALFFNLLVRSKARQAFGDNYLHSVLSLLE